MIETPRLWRIIWTDYTALLAALVPVVFLGIFVFLRLSGGSAADFSYVAIVVAVGSSVLLVWRCQTISSIFREGIDVPAVVSGVGFFRDRGTIACIYTFQGQKYESSNTVHKVKRTQAMTQGQNVTAVIDANHPQDAFIKELYL